MVELKPKQIGLGNLPVELFGLLFPFLDSLSIERFLLVNSACYRILNLNLERTKEIIDEIEACQFQDWSDITPFSPQRTLWVNDNFLELLALSLNSKTNFYSHLDQVRFDKICERFENSILHKNSMVRKYVKYLSYDTAILGDIRRPENILPKFHAHQIEAESNNKIALYLFHTYLYGENPNIQGLKKDPLYAQVQGAMGNFIRSQEILHPIRQKMKDKTIYEKISSVINKSDSDILTAEEVILHDHGMTHQFMADVLHTLIINKSKKIGEINVDERHLKKLAKFVIKYDLTSKTGWLVAGNRAQGKFRPSCQTWKVVVDNGSSLTHLHIEFHVFITI